MTVKNNWHDGELVNAAAMNAIGDAINAINPDEYHEYANLAAFPGTGVTDRVYVAVDTGFMYRWTGSVYARIGGGGSSAWADITGKPAVIAAGADQAAARSAIGVVDVLPSYVTNRSRPNAYNQARGAYNWKPDNTRRLNASLGKAAAGGLQHHLVIGDSISAGYMGSSSTPAWDTQKSWARVYSNLLAGAGVPSGGTGFVPVCDVAQVAADPQWAVTSGAWAATGLGYVGVSASGATMTFTSNVPGTRVDVYYFGGGGGLTVNVDGAGAVTVPVVGTVTASKYTVTGLADTTHTVAIKTTSATATYLLGASVTRGSGLVVNNVAEGSAQTSTWASFGPGTLNAARVGSLVTAAGITPQTVFCELGVNDVLNSVSAATFKANITTLRNQFPNSDFILVGPPSWNTFSDEMFDLADALNVPLVDWFSFTGGTQAGNPGAVNGLVNDSVGVHPNQAAHAAFGRNVALLVGGAAAPLDVTAAGKALLDDADAAAQRATLGAQAQDSDLTAIAALTPSAGDSLVHNGTAWTAEAALPVSITSPANGDRLSYTSGQWVNVPDDKQSTTAKNQANGYAGLDGTGRISAALLPFSAMEYKGAWNASTNSPTLANGSGSIGDFYRVSTAGSQNLGAGSIAFDVSDYAIYNGTVWEKLDTTDAVTSVAGLTGAITEAALTDALVDGTTNHVFTAADDTKLGGIAPNATANSTDAALLAAAEARIPAYLKAIAPSVYVSGEYYLCNSPSSTGSNNTQGNGTIRLSAWLITTPVTITRLFAEFTGAGEANSVYRVGLFADDGNGRPSTLIVDAGSISTGTGNAGTVATAGVPGCYELTVNQTLQPGLYWVGGAVQGASTTQPTMRTVSTANAFSPGGPMGTTLPAANTSHVGWAKFGVTGAFSNVSGPSSNATGPVRIGFKVS